MHQLASMDAGGPVGRLLARSAVGVTLRPDEALCSPDDPSPYYWHVVEGCIRTFSVTDDGRRDIGEFLLPGDLLSFDNLGTAHDAAEAVAQTTVRRYPRASVDALAERDPMLRTELRTLTIRRLHSAYGRTLLLARKSSVERIAAFLLEMARRLSSVNADSLYVPIGRTDIADHLSLTVERVLHALTQLAQTGSIELDHRGIRLLDRAALREQAGYPVRETPEPRE